MTSLVLKQLTRWCLLQVADITFNFWYRLSEEIYRKDKDRLTNMFQPYIGRLIIALCRHCQFDPDMVREFDTLLKILPM